MSAFEKFQNGLERVVGPVATKLSENKFITALTEGFMLTMPITLGVAGIAILSNLPIQAWANFLTTTGLFAVAQQVISLTLSLLAIYVVGAIGYRYTVNEGENGMTGAIFALASFITLMPVVSVEQKMGTPLSVLSTAKMGSEGVFVAILIGLFIPWLYCVLVKKNLVLKLPSSVPPMVSQSLAPTFVGIIIFSLIFAVKYGVSLTSYGDIFTLLTTIISQPIASFGTSPFALFTVFTLMNLIWFFGIHPNTIFSVYLPILMMAGTANQEAFLKGEALPFYAFAILSSSLQIGGTGNTLGLCIATFFAKSEKYKAMRKLVIPTNLFNINEPVIFGFPIMLNPIYFVPMILTPILSGLVGLAYIQVVPITLNPTISMPWVTPGFITTFLSGGVGLLGLWLISLTIHFITYLPFFLMDDKNALKQEQNHAA